MSTAGYTTPDVVLIWNDYWPIAVVLTGIAAGAWRLSKRRLAKAEDRIVDRVAGVVGEKTKPIQPDSNGGKSLPDLHEKVDTAIKTLNELQRAQTTTAAALLEHIANHRMDEHPERNPDG